MPPSQRHNLATRGHSPSQSPPSTHQKPNVATRGHSMNPAPLPNNLATRGHSLPQQFPLVFHTRPPRSEHVSNARQRYRVAKRLKFSNLKCLNLKFSNLKFNPGFPKTFSTLREPRRPRNAKGPHFPASPSSRRKKLQFSRHTRQKARTTLLAPPASGSVDVSQTLPHPVRDGYHCADLQLRSHACS